MIRTVAKENRVQRKGFCIFEASKARRESLSRYIAVRCQNTNRVGHERREVNTQTAVLLARYVDGDQPLECELMRFV